MKLLENITLSSQKTSLINSYLFILLGFCLPLSVSFSTAIIALIVILWILEGNFKPKLLIIHNNKLSYAFLAFFLIHPIGLLWSQNLEWGMHIVSKEWRMLLPLIFITIIREEHIKYYILAFLSAMSFSECISYLIWFELIPPFKSATVLNPTPFMGHISYNPFLAFSAFLLLYFIFLKREILPLSAKIFSIIFFVTMSINIFITGGRGGQVGYLILVALALVLYFRKKIIRSLMLIMFILPATVSLAYITSPLFNQRLNEAITDIRTVNENPNTSVGLRITFAKNSLELIKENPILGVGTGDFPDEYKIINDKNTPDALTTVNPHNMYLLVLAQTGIVGLIAMLSIFYTQIKTSLLCKNDLTAPALALPVLYIIISLSDSYLLGHNTALLFVYFSSFLYIKQSAQQ